jgi:hypothetical protein
MPRRAQLAMFGPRTMGVAAMSGVGKDEHALVHLIDPGSPILG